VEEKTIPSKIRANGKRGKGGGGGRAKKRAHLRQRISAHIIGGITTSQRGKAKKRSRRKDCKRDAYLWIRVLETGERGQ